MQTIVIVFKPFISDERLLKPFKSFYKFINQVNIYKINIKKN